jgi:hypothetical protein
LPKPVCIFQPVAERLAGAVTSVGKSAIKYALPEFALTTSLAVTFGGTGSAKLAYEAVPVPLNAEIGIAKSNWSVSSER